MTNTNGHVVCAQKFFRRKETKPILQVTVLKPIFGNFASGEGFFRGIAYASIVKTLKNSVSIF
jgi:hypothetical protein